MNLSLAELPERCDVLVVGSGPAGSAAATKLARAGWDVVMVDQRKFPREKVCGDGLIPDSHAALRELGVLDEVMSKAQSVSHVRCTGPRGASVDVPGTLAVLPRRDLDEILCRNAVNQGARMFAPVHFDAPLLDDAGRVIGASVSSAGVTRQIAARWVILASGAVPKALLAAQMCERQVPGGIALRGYVKNDVMRERITKMEIVWHRKLRPGYGWIFPCGDGVFNIGVGVFDMHSKAKDGRHVMEDVNLRQLFQDFCQFHTPASELMADGVMQGSLKGAPLRCSLRGAKFARPGLLVTGEAAGSTYAFTGEGIGKAMETGMLAAKALQQQRDQQWDDEACCQFYASSMADLLPRFKPYERANQVNAHPWLVDLLIWRAQKSERLVQRMSGVLNETANPGQLFTARGIYKLFTE